MCFCSHIASRNLFYAQVPGRTFLLQGYSTSIVWLVRTSWACFCREAAAVRCSSKEQLVEAVKKYSRLCNCSSKTLGWPNNLWKETAWAWRQRQFSLMFMCFCCFHVKCAAVGGTYQYLLLQFLFKDKRSVWKGTFHNHTSENRCLASCRIRSLKLERLVFDLWPCWWICWITTSGKTGSCSKCFINTFFTDLCTLTFKYELILNLINLCPYTWNHKSERRLFLFTKISSEQCSVVVRTPMLILAFCLSPAERDDPSSGGGKLLAGGPHPARLQRRRTVLVGQPADALHGLSQRGTFSHRVTFSNPSSCSSSSFYSQRAPGAKAICLTFKVHAGWSSPLSRSGSHSVAVMWYMVEHIDQKSYYPPLKAIYSL